MRYDPELHHRRSLRLRGHDYAEAGAYLVTICTHGRVTWLADIDADGTHPTAFGTVVEACWRDVPRHLEGVGLDTFVIMPDHLHGIIVLPQRRGDTATGHATWQGSAPGSLSAILQNLKAVSTRRLRAAGFELSEGVWQRGFHDRILPDEAELAGARAYIDGNPARWWAEHGGDQP